jgi:hypothetical protein
MKLFLCVDSSSYQRLCTSVITGDDQITDGVGRPEIVESPTDLFTVHQNLSRRLTWRDNRKDLKCVATHIALDGEMKPTVIQISVRCK